jgi:hypothetical protein
MQIIRNEGNVSFADNSGVVFKIVPTNSVIDVIDDKFLQLKFGSELFRLNAEEVTATQLLAGTLNPFTGNAFDLILILEKIFFFELGGGGGSQDLESVLIEGSYSGANHIDFEANYGVRLFNSSTLREGTKDGMLGGQKGIAQICAVGYELKWEAGRLYVMDGNGIYIRHSLYNFTITPTVNDDVTLGFLPGSRWSLDNGDTYICTDETTGAAVWELESNGVPTLAQVLISGKSAGDSSIIDIDKLDFNTATLTAALEGQLAWNDTDGTLDLGLKGGLKNKLGQQLVVRARNTSGSTISKGSVVKIVGVSGGFVGINLAQADTDTNSATAFGIVAEDIADATNGFVAINGIVHNVNTNAFTEGDILYLSPTTPGEITNVKPVSPDHAVVVGYVAKKSAGDGHILLHVQNGYELDELHDVLITTPENGNFLEYNGSLWVNRGIVYTIELIDALTVDFYAPYDLKINTTTNILNAPSITIQDDGVAYTLTNTIVVGSKITVTASVAGVVNLNITKA